jgi:DNA-binding transcriptional MocR family regulator
MVRPGSGPDDDLFPFVVWGRLLRRYLRRMSPSLFRYVRAGAGHEALREAIASYLVLPRALIEPFARAKWYADRQTASLEQAALADFIREGHFEQHVRRMRRVYKGRREGKSARGARDSPT